MFIIIVEVPQDSLLHAYRYVHVLYITGCPNDCSTVQILPSFSTVNGKCTSANRASAAPALVVSEKTNALPVERMSS